MFVVLLLDSTRFFRDALSGNAVYLIVVWFVHDMVCGWLLSRCEAYGISIVKILFNLLSRCEFYEFVIPNWKYRLVLDFIFIRPSTGSIKLIRLFLLDGLVG